MPGFGNVIISDPEGKEYWYNGIFLTLDRPYHRPAGERTSPGRTPRPSRPATTCSASTTRAPPPTRATTCPARSATASSPTASSALPWDAALRHHHLPRHRRRHQRPRLLAGLRPAGARADASVRPLDPSAEDLGLRRPLGRLPPGEGLPRRRATSRSASSARSSTPSTGRATAASTTSSRRRETRPSASRPASTNLGRREQVGLEDQLLMISTTSVEDPRARALGPPRLLPIGYARRHGIEDRRSSSLVVLVRLCAAAPLPGPSRQPWHPRHRGARDAALLDDVERRSFQFFWDLADPHTLLIPDRAPTPSFSSIAAVGFGLTAYGIGAERGYVTRAEAAERTLATLRSLLAMRQGPEPRGVSGYKGFFYHFLDMKTGRALQDRRAVDDRHLAAHRRRALRAVVLRSATTPPRRRSAPPPRRSTSASTGRGSRRGKPAISMGWTPEEGFHTYDWRGYNEAMIVYVLALGSPTHPIDAGAWGEYTKTVSLGDVLRPGARPLRAALRPPVLARLDRLPRHPGRVHARHGHRLLRELPPRHARRSTPTRSTIRTATATTATRIWGLTACDGPLDATLTIDGRRRTLLQLRRARRRPRARSATTARSRRPPPSRSIVFTPELSIAGPARDARAATASNLYSKYGFLDAFNPTLRTSQASDRAGTSIRRRAGSTSTTSASIRGRSSP